MIQIRSDKDLHQVVVAEMENRPPDLSLTYLVALFLLSVCPAALAFVLTVPFAQETLTPESSWSISSLTSGPLHRWE